MFKIKEIITEKEKQEIKKIDKRIKKKVIKLSLWDYCLNKILGLQKKIDKVNKYRVEKRILGQKDFYYHINGLRRETLQFKKHMIIFNSYLNTLEKEYKKEIESNKKIKKAFKTLMEESNNL